jgi:hypothetical protein
VAKSEDPDYSVSAMPIPDTAGLWETDLVAFAFETVLHLKLAWGQQHAVSSERATGRVL